MTYLKAMAGHTGLAKARAYFERDGRALAHDYINLNAPQVDGPEGLPSYGDFAWDEAMDETRRAYGNDAPVRGRAARTYKHFVVSPDPGDEVGLADLRRLAVRWARECFGDHQVAIVYHDDNARGIPHAHVVVNNTNLATGRRLRTEDPAALNGRLQAISRELGLSHFEGRIDAAHPDTRKSAGRAGAGARGRYQRVHVGRAEAELAGRGAYSWVADIRARVDVARAVGRTPAEVVGALASMGVDVGEGRGGEWVYSLASCPSRRVGAVKLGTDYRRSAIACEVTGPLRAPLSQATREQVGEAAARAIDAGDLAGLRELAGAVGEVSRTRATSLRGLERAAERARAAGREGRAEAIAGAAAYARKHGLLPERAERGAGKGAGKRKARGSGGHISAGQRPDGDGTARGREADRRDGRQR